LPVSDDVGVRLALTCARASLAIILAPSDVTSTLIGAATTQSPANCEVARIARRYFQPPPSPHPCVLCGRSPGPPLRLSHVSKC
jgi:hypothetical protein